MKAVGCQCSSQAAKAGVSNQSRKHITIIEDKLQLLKNGRNEMLNC